MSATIERRPNLPGWVEFRMPANNPLDSADVILSYSVWSRGQIRVISALEMAELPDRSGVGPQWHISVSRGPKKRPRPTDVRAALRAFQMHGAEEDNHHPGVARHFWVPVDPAHRVDCECKEEEAVITEPDGYKWTNPREGDGECRGCELSRMTGAACSLHPTEPA